MPFNGDINGGPVKLELNMAWFYECLSRLGFKLDFRATYRHPIYSEKDAIQNTVDAFEHHIEEAFKDWVHYKVFGVWRRRSIKQTYRNRHVSEFLCAHTIEYTDTHPQVVLVSEEEEEEEIIFDEDEKKYNGYADF
jgi:hypothetical protein